MTSHFLFRVISVAARCHLSAVILFCALWACELRAQFVPIPPFSGAVSEDFEAFVPGFTNAPFPILGGAATLQTTNSVGIDRPGVFNFLLGDSSANAPFECAVPADGQNLLGIENGLGKGFVDVVFTNTTRAFGGYWGTTSDTNNPGTLTFSFFDAADQQIGLPQTVTYIRYSGDGMMEWHGWFSSTAFKHVRVTSSGTTIVGDSLRAGEIGFSVITSIAPLNATQFVLQGSGTTGVVYNVQASTNLVLTNWTTLGTVQPNASGNFLFTNASALSWRFYRLQAP